MSGGQQQQFLTIAGRWKQHQAILEGTMPKREQGLAVVMFYAGFAAALEANVEVAGFPEHEAVALLAALKREADHFAGLAAAVLGGNGSPN